MSAMPTFAERRGDCPHSCADAEVIFHGASRSRGTFLRSRHVVVGCLWIVGSEGGHHEGAGQIADRRVNGLPPAQVLAEFDRSLDRYADMSYPELKALLYTPRDYVAALPFDPTKARYFEMIKHRLKMTDAEVVTFKKNGFVSIDQDRRLNFPAAYQQIYTSDLPVFITSDSILHALHKSYDAMLKELEISFFARTIDDILVDCHDALLYAARANDMAELRTMTRPMRLTAMLRSVMASPLGLGDAPDRKRHTDAWKRLSIS